MLNFILRWVINAATLIFIAYYVPNFHVQNFYSALAAALILGIVNAIIRPLLVILTLPLNILTLGLFTFIINALLLLLTSTLVKGFTIDTFPAALLAAVIIWAVSIITSSIFRQA